jgi:transcription elongation factor Elf1
MTSFKCGICNIFTSEFPALSRKDNKTELCNKCGQNEAMNEYMERV